MTEPRDIRRIFEDGTAIDAAFAAAAHAAAREARVLGRPLIVVWQDGRVVELGPDQLPLEGAVPSTETPATDN